MQNLIADSFEFAFLDDRSFYSEHFLMKFLLLKQIEKLRK